MAKRKLSYADASKRYEEAMRPPDLRDIKGGKLNEKAASQFALLRSNRDYMSDVHPNAHPAKLLSHEGAKTLAARHAELQAKGEFLGHARQTDLSSTSGWSEDSPPRDQAGKFTNK